MYTCKDANQIELYTPGLVITPEGRFITMKENENHDVFFQNILGYLLKNNGSVPRKIMNERNLATLMTMLLQEFHYLPYQGCTSGDREYREGDIFISALEEISTPQFEAIVQLIDSMKNRYHYDISIFQINWDQTIGDAILDKEVIINELEKRKRKKAK